MENGSGLSRNERVSARLLAQIVQDAMRRPFADVFISSLPIVGVDSTVKTRLVDHPIAGHAYIKTGTLANVSAIAGMIDGPNQQKVVIVAILNQDHLQGGREVLDSVLKEAWQIVVSYKL